MLSGSHIMDRDAGCENRQGVQEVQETQGIFARE